MHSAVYTGRLRHRRFGPVPHAFSYGITLLWLDLAELDDVFRGRWLWSVRRPALARFRREDYLGGDGQPLDVAVRDRVARETGRRPKGPIRLLTQIRMLGFCFNPVSFYYCYDEHDTRVEAIVAEITNTPWNERHAYVLRTDARRARCASACPRPFTSRPSCRWTWTTTGASRPRPTRSPCTCRTCAVEIASSMRR